MTPGPPSAAETSVRPIGESGAGSTPTVVRVVLADDDIRLRDRIRDLLADDGFDVVAAVADTDQALRMIEEARPDVVLSDLRMPGGGALELLTRLRDDWITVPVVILTAYDDAGLSEVAFSLGAAAFLTKGCSADLLIAQLRSACAGSSRTDWPQPDVLDGSGPATTRSEGS
jgi:DNA-binding NarL/FixJ family response regulator